MPGGGGTYNPPRGLSQPIANLMFETIVYMRKVKFTQDLFDMKLGGILSEFPILDVSTHSRPVITIKFTHTTCHVLPFRHL